MNLRSASTLAPRPAVSVSNERFDRLDALRGVAIVWMVGFHFCYDLNHFNLLQPHQAFLSDPFWTTQRVVIVSMFLGCAGLGQAVALSAGLAWPRFWRRWAQVAGGALLVSAGSALMFPGSWISFGVLHGIALMLLLVRLLVPRLQRHGLAQPVLWGLGAFVIWLPFQWGHAALNPRALNWIGLVSRLPLTEDYVPLFPWLGVVLWGVAAGLALLRWRRDWLAGPLAAPLRPLAVLGRWSLSVYLLHQPLLIGSLLAWRWLSGHG